MGNHACCQRQTPNQKDQGQIFISSAEITKHKQSSLIHQENQSKLDQNQIRSRRISIYKITLPTGAVYQGQIKCGLPHGKGIEFHNSSEIYDGDFVQGKKYGFGKYKYSNGLIYEGQFVENAMQGKGKLLWPCGDIYEGQFKDNLMHGEGVYTMAGGQGYYKGHYKEGKKHGQGQMVMKGQKYSGLWNEGVYINSVYIH